MGPQSRAGRSATASRSTLSQRSRDDTLETDPENADLQGRDFQALAGSPRFTRMTREPEDPSEKICPVYDAAVEGDAETVRALRDEIDDPDILWRCWSSQAAPVTLASLTCCLRNLSRKT